MTRLTLTLNLHTLISIKVFVIIFWDKIRYIIIINIIIFFYFFVTVIFMVICITFMSTCLIQDIVRRKANIIFRNI